MSLGSVDVSSVFEAASSVSTGGKKVLMWSLVLLLKIT
jgi:hypothetical protein